MLESSEPPAGGDSTFMRFNVDAVDAKSAAKNMIVNLADYMPDSMTDTVVKVEEVSEKEVPKDEFNSLLAKLMALVGVGKLAGNQENQPKKE